LREQGFTPFLRPEHTREGEWFRLTGFNQDDGNQIKVEVESEVGAAYTLGVRKGSPGHRIMHRTFGPGPASWANGGVQIKLVPGTRGDGVVFVNVAAAQHGEPF
jgi:hypothetical protein